MAWRRVALVGAHHGVADHPLERAQRIAVVQVRSFRVHPRHGEAGAQLVHQAAEGVELFGLVAIEPAEAAVGRAAVERLTRRLLEVRRDAIVGVQPALVLQQAAFARDLDADEAFLEPDALLVAPGEAELPGPGRGIEGLEDGAVLVDDERRGDAPGLPARGPVAAPEVERCARVVAHGVVQRDAGLRLRLGEVLGLGEAQTPVQVHSHEATPLQYGFTPTVREDATEFRKRG
jgi:hypothetical protein